MRRPAPFHVILITARFARAAALTPSICRALLAAKLTSLAWRNVLCSSRCAWYSSHSREVSTRASRGLFLVPLCFSPLFVVTGYKSAKASFQRRLRQLAIDRTRFDVDQRTPMSEDEAICAQIKPNTVSIRDSVKLLPTRRVDESLGVSLKPCLE